MLVFSCRCKSLQNHILFTIWEAYLAGQKAKKRCFYNPLKFAIFYFYGGPQKKSLTLGQLSDMNRNEC